MWIFTLFTIFLRLNIIIQEIFILKGCYEGFLGCKSECTHLMCSQWQPRWRGLCRACSEPGRWTGTSSLAPNQAPASSHGLQAQVWKASHVDPDAPSSACAGDVRHAGKNNQHTVQNVEKKKKGVFRFRVQSFSHNHYHHTALISAAALTHHT